MKNYLVVWLFIFLATLPLYAQQVENLKIKGTRLDDLLRMLARKAEVNLVLSQAMEQEVTIDFKDSFSPKKLMEILTDTYGYKIEIIDNIYRIVPKKDSENLPQNAGKKPQEQKENKIQQQSFQLKFIPVEKVAKKVQAMLSVQGEIDINPISNALFVRDREVNVAAITEYIAFVNLPPDASSTVRFEKRTFQLRRLLPSEIQKDIQRFLSPQSQVLVNDQSRILTIVDNPQVLERIASFIEKADVPQPQVYIQCRFVEVAMDSRTQLGTRFEFNNISVNGRTASASSEFLPLAGGGQDTFLFSVVDSDDFRLDFSAFADRSNVRLLATPNLLCNNRETSTIQVVTKIPFVQAQVRNSDNQDVAQTIAFEEVGVSLLVTPEVFPDGYVKMKVVPEVSEVVDFVLDTPVTKLKTLDANVTIKSGQRLIMGGLLEDQIRKTRSKIPLLGDIPVVGFIFSREDQSIVKTELFIFLDVAIVDDNTLQKMTKSAEKRQEIRHDNFDVEFEFYPHVKEKLDMYNVKTEEEEPFSYMFKRHKDNK